MRILAVRPGPEFSVQDVHRGWTRAFAELGVDILDLDYSARIDFYAQHPNVDSLRDAATLASESLRATLFDTQPDWLFITSGFFISPPVFTHARRHGIKIALLATECPYEDDALLSKAKAAHVDWLGLNDPTNLDQFADLARVEYVPHAYDPTLHHPTQPAPAFVSDFCFVGTGYPSRVAFLEQINWSGIDVALAGNWRETTEHSPLRKHIAHDLDDCVLNDDAVRYYTSTKASANLYRHEAQRPELSAGWSMGPREVELAACGTFFLRDPRPESNEVLHMLPTFDGPHDFEDQLRWWLDHDDARTTAATQARAAVEDRTFSANARRFLRATESL